MYIANPTLVLTGVVLLIPPGLLLFSHVRRLHTVPAPRTAPD